MKHRISTPSRLARAGAVVSALMLGGCLAAGTAFADDALDGTALDDAVASIVYPDVLTPGLHTDYVAPDATLSDAGSAISAFDLRHFGGAVSYDAAAKKSVITGGTNYVTPVKLQNPFGSCWSFACTAASETSMLTSLDTNDNGMLDGSVDYESAASGESGDLAYAASDLSERHLAYFAFSHPTTYGLYSSQAGEGFYLSDCTNDAAEIMDAGGMTFLGMSTYSSGIGPVAESYAPYISDEGWIQVPTTQAPVGDNLIYKYFLSYDKALAYMNETWDADVIKAFNEKYSLHITSYSVIPRVAKIGTWSVDQDKTYGVVAELSNSNIVASTKNKDGSLTADEMSQMKRELQEGHPISVALYADQSRPGDSITSAHSYINTDTWAQYTYDTLRVSHAVAIVGYDDDYDASNFTHTVYKQDSKGNWVVDEANTAKTTPAGNGAWIVKNSWGSTDQDDPLQVLNWGIDGSGYFYLSYYDANVSLMESFEYDVSDEAQERESYDCYQYDLANVREDYSYSTSEPFEMVNVFDGPESDEKPVMIRDLGCLTGAPDDTTTLSIYVMDDGEDATSVIDAGEPAATVSETYDSAGFHRLHLDKGVTIAPGQKFAVVQTTKRANGDYEYTFGAGISKTFVDAYNAVMEPLLSDAIGSYCVTVVNDGESLVKSGNTWADWNEQSAAANKIETQKNIAQVHATGARIREKAKLETDEGTKAVLNSIADNLEKFNVDSALAIDNWSIKAYGDDVDWTASVRTATTVKAWGQVAKFTCDTNLSDATYRWQYSRDGGLTWRNCAKKATSSPSYQVAATKTRAGYLFRCVVTSGDVELTTDSVGFDLQIPKATASITPPSGRGKGATLTCTANVPLTRYQWQCRTFFGGWRVCTVNDVTDPTAATCQIKGKSARSLYQFRCFVRTEDGGKLYTNKVENV